MKKDKIKKFFSTVIMTVMLVGLFPVGASAETITNNALGNSLLSLGQGDEMKSNHGTIQTNCGMILNNTADGVMKSNYGLVVNNYGFIDKCC